MFKKGRKRVLRTPQEAAPYGLPLPGLEKEIPLGEFLQRMTLRLGKNPCGGCARRAAAMNRWLVFRPRRRT